MDRFEVKDGKKNVVLGLVFLVLGCAVMAGFFATGNPATVKDIVPWQLRLLIAAFGGMFLLIAAVTFFSGKLKPKLYYTADEMGICDYTALAKVEIPWHAVKHVGFDQKANALVLDFNRPVVYAVGEMDGKTQFEKHRKSVLYMKGKSLDRVKVLTTLATMREKYYAASVLRRNQEMVEKRRKRWEARNTRPEEDYNLLVKIATDISGGDTEVLDKLRPALKDWKAWCNANPKLMQAWDTSEDSGRATISVLAMLEALSPKYIYLCDMDMITDWGIVPQRIQELLDAQQSGIRLGEFIDPETGKQQVAVDLFEEMYARLAQQGWLVHNVEIDFGFYVPLYVIPRGKFQRLNDWMIQFYEGFSMDAGW